MSPAIALLRRLGATVRIDADGRIETEAPHGLQPVAISTAPYPGLATDWQPPLVAALTQAAGVSAIHETVFEARRGCGLPGPTTMPSPSTTRTSR